MHPPARSPLHPAAASVLFLRAHAVQYGELPRELRVPAEVLSTAYIEAERARARPINTEEQPWEFVDEITEKLDNYVAIPPEQKLSVEWCSHK